MQKTILLAVLGVLWGSMLAQIPDGYYDETAGLSGTALKSALHNIIDDHTEVSYDDVKTYLQVLDEDPDDSDYIKLIYKGTSILKTDFNTSGDGWNREHLWPQSHGDFGTSMGPGTDLHALRPCDVSINTSRGNKDFDDGGTAHTEATGCYSDSDSWQVRDAVKGDVARAIFYMCVRWEGDETDEPDLEVVDYISEASSNGYGELGMLSTLLEWHEDDPVDDAEISRNNIIYNNYQSNRNPFIDYPEFAANIWSGEVDPEPSNHASEFSAHTITLQWTDATGEVLPEAYLIRMSSTGFDAIESPIDGISVDDDWSNKNVSYGVEKYTFGNLAPGTLYYFKIFAYTGSSTNIDYKTTGEVMQVAIEAM